MDLQYCFIIVSFYTCSSAYKLLFSIISIYHLQFNVNYTLKVCFYLCVFLQETRWAIHSCLLQLIQVICRLSPQAILEFLYSELPQELVAEMQQHYDGNYLLFCNHKEVVFLHNLLCISIDNCKF